MRSGPILSGMIFFVIAVSGCKSKNSSNSSDASSGNISDGGATAQGFTTPDSALDAYGKALLDGDVDAFRKIAAKNRKSLQALDAFVQLEKDKFRKNAAQTNLQALAPLQGFGSAKAKRFSAEIEGDQASIVQLFERKLGIQTGVHFRKFNFAKSNGLWYFVGSEFGDSSELPPKYAWTQPALPRKFGTADRTPKNPLGQAKSSKSEKDSVANDTQKSDAPSLVHNSKTQPLQRIRTEFDLFNGKDLSGWTYLPMKNSRHRNNRSWFVDKQREVLYCIGGDRNELATLNEFQDFDLKLQWRWRPGAKVLPNGSGVVVRVNGRDSKGTSPKGLEIDLRPQEDKSIGLGNGTFIAYNVSLENSRGVAEGDKNRILGWSRQPAPIVEESWNDLHVSCSGDRVTVTLNGTLVNEGWSLSATKGKVVLRNQDSGVEFRSIKLTENKSPPAKVSNPISKSAEKTSNATKKPAKIIRPDVAERSKYPVPDEKIRADVLNLVRDVYKSQFDSAETAKAQSELASEIVADSAKMEDPNQRFEMLDVARKITIAVPEVTTTFEIIDRLDAEFQVDALALKIQSLVQLSKSKVATSERVDFVDRLIEVAEQAIAVDAFQDCVKLLELAKDNTRPSREFSRFRKISNRLDEVKKLESDFSRLKPFLEILQSKPKDPTASLKVGRFRCFVQGQWKLGLKLLSQSSDTRLKSIAESDLASPRETKAQILIGDQWWGLASEHDGTVQIQIRKRAAYWYRFALDQATGLQKQKLKSRLEKVTSGN